MVQRKQLKTRLLLWTVIWILTTGCDEQVTQVAREAADRQAQQNATMAELQQEVAHGTRSLVAADATARRAIIGVHHELQAEQKRLDTGWDALQTERRQIARERRTESLLVPTLEAAGAVLVVVVLLGFLGHTLAGLRTSEPVDAELSELLVAQLLAERPAEDFPHRRLAGSFVASAALPGPDKSAGSPATI